ncbi:hypothetical protein H0H93_016748 [Arthromyces matolae]|nr:hypothetical protein H0H93_016748 [Arthromyces matolae]
MANIAQSRCKILELEKNSSGEHGKARSSNASGQSRDPQAEEARRKNQLEESIRKMREIKEQEQERARSENLRKEREAAARKAQEEETRKQREAAQAKERARQLAWKMATDSEFERSCQRDKDLLSGRGSQWDEEFAVERFLLVLSDFEACKFSESKPLTFVNIPWPVLRPIQQRSASKSLTLTTSDITWQEVEQFFESWTASTGYTSTVSYRKVVERTHRAFHPDKWRSRKLLDTVQDQHLRQALEKAGNVVAQAMTPIWMETKT